MAAISKEAKERKMRERIENEQKSQDIQFSLTSMQKHLFYIAAPATVFLGLYLLWNSRKTKTVDNLEPQTIVLENSPPKPESKKKKYVSLFE